MNKQSCNLTLMILMVCVPVGIIRADQGSDRSGAISDCDSRCAVLEGESRYRCLKTCVNTRKRNAPVGENQVKRKISYCEKACESYRGIENITCRRVCLDNKRYIPPKKKDPAASENPTPCESRCSVLTGPNRDNCIARCEKKSRFNSKDISGKQ